MVDASREMASTASYELSFDVTSSAVCAPSKARCADSTTVELCNARGTAIETTYNCPDSCARGGCQASSTADTCAGAPTIGDGILVYAHPDDLTDDVVFTEPDCTSSSANFPDLVYEVTVEPNEVLRVKSTEARIILMDDCTDPDGTCMPMDYANPFGTSPDGLFWSPQQTRTINVVADVVFTDRATRLQIDKLPVECTADARQCSPNGEAVQTCEPWGLWRSMECQTTCSNGRCDLPTGEYCQDAIELSAGMSVSGSFGDFNDDVSSFSSGCYTNGSDAVYEVDLTQGEVLETKLLGPSGSSVALFDVCRQSGSNACLGSSMGEREWTFVAPSTGTYFVAVIDGSSWADSDEFLLEIDVHPEGTCTSNCDDPTQCTVGSAQCIDSDTLEQCPNGLTEQRECEFGCSNAACNPPANDVCSGATTIPRDGDFHTQSVYLAPDYTSSVDMGSTINECPNVGTSGPDAIYRLDALAGDVVSAYWPDRQGVYGWLTSDCTSASQFCMSGSSRGVLTQTIPTTGVYWFVLDSNTTAADEALTLDVRLAPTICQPGASTCDASTGVISYCNAAGTAYKDYVCQGGCDSSTGQPRCGEPRGEQCVDAIDATAGGVFSAVIDRYDDTFTHTTNTCISSSSDGGDIIYSVDLAAGDTVEATTTLAQNDAGALYILDDCHTPDPDSACLEGEFGYSGETVTVSHTATAAETVYVVVDSRQRSASYTRSVEIVVQ
jgi:hypothetical protein